MSFDFDNIPTNNADVIEQHSRSFSMASRLLPFAIRSDVKKLYAWCRWCDDAVDDAPNSAAAKERLELLREDVRRIYDGLPVKHPSSQWLADVVNAYRIPIDLPMDLLDGMETDLGNPVLETVDELLLYCYQAAGTVGLMMCRIMGVTDPRAFAKAKALGMAMQLTNIARDINEDWQNERRYVPTQWLSLVPKKDVSPTDRETRFAVEQLLRRADQLYTDGYSGLDYLPDGARLAIRLAGNVYQEIGNEIRKRNYSVMKRRAFVTFGQKLLLAMGCLRDEAAFRANRLLGRFARQTPNPTRFFPTYIEGNFEMNNETRYLGYLGLSLTFIMGTTLFALVGINPKESVYETLPWIYAGGCAVFATATGLIARRISQQLNLESVENN